MPEQSRFSDRFKKPETMLIMMAGVMAFSFTPWMTLLNNFVVERAGFTGWEIGVLQSIREVPGFLAFAAVFLLLIWREQTVAFIFLAMLGIGVAMTGYFPSTIGLYCTTVVMSLGFHYYETMQQSMTLQLIDMERTPIVLGQQISARSFASVLGYVLVFAVLFLSGMEISSIDFANLNLKNLQLENINYELIYLLAGGSTLVFVFLAWRFFPKFESKVSQNKRIILRKRYWLFYGLTFLSGARRQIFIVFAGFFMVEKFGLNVGFITLLFLINHLINIYLAPRIGRLIAYWGERRALTFEYIGLILVFSSYAFVENAYVAGGLYVIDHLFFAFAIGIKSYFQKIADPAEIASSAGVSFTINHIAAVVIPAVFGLIWLASPSAVFLAGAAMACCSLILARNVPRDPRPGQEVIIGPKFTLAAEKTA